MDEKVLPNYDDTFEESDFEPKALHDYESGIEVGYWLAIQELFSAKDKNPNSASAWSDWLEQQGIKNGVIKDE